MKVKCIVNEVSKLKRKFRVSGESTSLIYNITLDKVYIVYGVSIYDNKLYYLIINDSSKPEWRQTACFEVVNHKLPEDWLFKEYVYSNSKLRAIISYSSMIENEEHYDKLIDGEEEDRIIFYKMVENMRKKSEEEL